MSDKNGGYTTWSIIFLIGVWGFFLVDVHQVGKIKILAEQIESFAKQESMELEKKKFDLEEKSWREVSYPQEAIDKFIAEGYFFWLVGIALIFASPVIYRELKHFD